MGQHPADDWYERMDELCPEQVFRSVYGVVKLLYRTPGDGTKWTVADWWGRSWAHMDSTVEPGELVERLSDDYSGEAV